MGKVQYHVTPAKSGGWQVKKAGAERAIANFDTKKEAIARGREVSRKNEGELVIHNLDGKIAQKDSHGNDPSDVPG